MAVAPARSNEAPRAGRKRFAPRVRGPYRWAMQLAPTDRTRHRRLAERGSFDIELINAIIDEALICHVGFDVDGAPVVIPTIHSRIDDHVYLHGAVGNNMLRSLDRGVDACVTMTIIDGLVLARSA